MNAKARIANYIVLRGRYTRHLGLYQGKAGIMLAMFLYARKSGISVFRDFADDLFEDVQGQLSDSLPQGLADGLAGISYAMAYLCNNGFLSFNPNEVLYEIDQKIMETDPRRTKDFSFDSGALGIWFYIQERLRSQYHVTSLDEQYINELSAAISPAVLDENRERRLLDNLSAPAFDRDEYVGHELGINGGSAFYLIKDYFEP